jgi:hypothetical protein
LPHSEILGSKLVRSSPRLIAAYHVLHRLSAPRHPPDALTTLDCSHDRCPHSACAPRSQERPVFDPQGPKTFACQMHPVATACGLSLVRQDRVCPARPNAFPLHNVKHPRIPKGTANLFASRTAGGARRDRTDDLLNANQALSQLSYGPSADSLRHGGPGTTRTSDLTLIRGAL